MATTPFTANDLAAALRALPATTRYWVAYSGGCDSTVLVHALATLRPQLPIRELRVLHIDHGLHPDSADWARHCRASAAELGLLCDSVRVDARPIAGESREAAARRARYDALAQHVGPGEILLLAHHQDDQAETVLLQLLRGAGPRGLAAMAPVEPFAAGYLARPLLTYPRSALIMYAQHYDLMWIEDPSNFDTRYDRNFVRHKVLPPLSEHWPGFPKTLGRVATLQAECAQLLDALAHEDWSRLQEESGRLLRVEGLSHLDSPRRRNVLRYALRLRGLSTPSHAQLEEVEQMLNAAPDSEPCVHWPNGEVRRYRDRLYLGAPREEPDLSVPIVWNMYGELRLPGDLGHLAATHRKGAGIKTLLCRTEPVTVRFRRGGELCQPAGNAHRRELKKLFQEWGVPPWQRARVPLIYVGERLAAVVGHCVCETFAAEPGEPGLVVEQISGAP